MINTGPLFRARVVRLGFVCEFEGLMFHTIMVFPLIKANISTGPAFSKPPFVSRDRVQGRGPWEDGVGGLRAGPTFCFPKWALPSGAALPGGLPALDREPVSPWLLKR